MIEYRLSDDCKLILADDVVSHFMKHRQLRLWSREAGGQLFATFDGPNVTVREATGPRRGDRRGRWHYIPDRGAENTEIAAMYGKGLHFVGDWHTHPQAVPSPSKLDFDSLQECVQRSEHQLNGFFLIVVGRRAPPQGLHITFHYKGGLHRLSLRHN